MRGFNSSTLLKGTRSIEDEDDLDSEEAEQRLRDRYARLLERDSVPRLQRNLCKPVDDIWRPIDRINGVGVGPTQGASLIAISSASSR